MVEVQMLPERPVSLVVLWHATESDALLLYPAWNTGLPLTPVIASYWPTTQTQCWTQRYSLQLYIRGTDLILLQA